jgi:hypothetical protein
MPRKQRTAIRSSGERQVVARLRSGSRVGQPRGTRNHEITAEQPNFIGSRTRPRSTPTDAMGVLPHAPTADGPAPRGRLPRSLTTSASLRHRSEADRPRPLSRRLPHFRRLRSPRWRSDGPEDTPRGRADPANGGAAGSDVAIRRASPSRTAAYQLIPGESQRRAYRRRNNQPAARIRRHPGTPRASPDLFGRRRGDDLKTAIAEVPRRGGREPDRSAVAGRSSRFPPWFMYLKRLTGLTSHPRRVTGTERGDHGADDAPVPDGGASGTGRHRHREGRASAAPRAGARRRSLSLLHETTSPTAARP